MKPIELSSNFSSTASAMEPDQEIPLSGEESPLREHLAEVTGFRVLKLFKMIAFQKLMILSIYRLILYINKLYQDVNTAKEYFSEKDFYFFIISIITLITPPLVYSIYLIGKWLMINR